jgi:hypothetical protein
MTAIVGFTCLEGVMMMADTEETTSSDTKSDCDKLYHFPAPDGIVVTGGAGDAHLIECANQEMQHFFAKGEFQKPDALLDGEGLRAALNDFAQEFFADTIAQFAGMSPALVPGFDMLIAVNLHRKSTLLFRWTHNRVRWIPQGMHDCIGAGVTQLHPMLRDFEFMPTKETALFCGIRMMLQAKRIVQGVGGKTEALFLNHDGSLTTYGTENTQRIESLVGNFEQFLNKFVYTTISNVSPDVAEREENSLNALKILPEMLKGYRDRYRELLENPVM